MQATHYQPYLHHKGPYEILPVVFSYFFALSYVETENRKGLNLLDEYTEDEDMLFYVNTKHTYTPIYR